MSFHVLLITREQSCWSFICFRVYFFTTFTSTNFTRASHKINTSGCRNSTVSPKLSRVTSSSRWTWVGGPLALHSWSATTLTHKMAFLGISMHFFQKIYITNMSGMLFLLFVQSLLRSWAIEGKWEGYYGEKNYLDMSFCSYLFERASEIKKTAIYCLLVFTCCNRKREPWHVISANTLTKDYQLVTMCESLLSQWTAHKTLCDCKSQGENLCSRPLLKISTSLITAQNILSWRLF